MLLKFNSLKPGGKYTGTVSFRDGEIKDVDDKEAKRVLADFPEKFSEATEEDIANAKVDKSGDVSEPDDDTNTTEEETEPDPLEGLNPQEKAAYGRAMSKLEADENAELTEFEQSVLDMVETPEEAEEEN